MRRAKRPRRLTAPSFLTLRGDNAARRLGQGAHSGVFTTPAPGKIDMVRLTARLLVASCGVLLPISAHAGLSVYLRNYYTEYQVVKDCIEREQLSAEDAVKAKDAMAKIEAYYMQRDATINKDKLVKQAVSNKNQAFKMMKETSKIDAREFCRGSLNDLVSKLHDIEADASPKKSGS